MLHRANSAGNMMNNLYNNPNVVNNNNNINNAGGRRSSSPAIPSSLANNLGGAALGMPHRKPDFAEGSILEERDARSQRAIARFRVGPLLGQGGFAKCYDVKDLETGEHLALKVCERQKLIQTKTMGKLQTEISIHRRMNHKNIVKFHRTFQDEWNIYILLELCRGSTLMDLSKQRKRFAIPEAQHVMIQTLMACQYMHSTNVIHRDLKLGNMMMDHEMNVKIGDFGLAAELLYDGERKRTICGTPNYIAPEILQGSGEGHSFEADTWSIGVILYTLLVGEPPFQTSDVKQTYSRIRQCRYTFPIGIEVPEVAKDLIHRMLKSDPNSRPALMEIRNHPFFAGAPSCAPLSLYPSRLRAEKEARMSMMEKPQQQQQAGSGVGGGACCGGEMKQPAATDLKQQQQQLHHQLQPMSGREPLRPIFNGGVAGNWPSSNNNNNNHNNNNNPQQHQQPISSRFASSASTTAAPSQDVPPPPPPKLFSGAPVPLAGAAPAPIPLNRRPSTTSTTTTIGATTTGSTVSNAQQQQQQQMEPPAAIVLTGRIGSADMFGAGGQQQQQQDQHINKQYKMDKEEHDHFAAAHEELHRTLIVEAAPMTMMAAAGSGSSNRPAVYPGCQPPAVWVTDYADFSNRYGLAYRLSSGHTGCHYNDNTKLVWEPVTNRAEYYSRVKETVSGQQVVSDQKQAFTMEESPESLSKKTTLIKYFKSYIRAGGKRDSAEVVHCSSGSSVPSSAVPTRALSEPNMTSDMIYVKRWMLTPQAMVFRLSNRVIQVCFFDKTEVVLASESRIVTFSDAIGNRRTMPLTAVNAEGGELAQKLMLTKDILSRLIANRDI